MAEFDAKKKGSQIIFLGTGPSTCVPWLRCLMNQEEESLDECESNVNENDHNHMITNQNYTNTYNNENCACNTAGIEGEEKREDTCGGEEKEEEKVEAEVKVEKSTFIKKSRNVCEVCVESNENKYSKNRRRNPSILIKYKNSEANRKKYDAEYCNILIDCGKTFRDAVENFFYKNRIRNIDAVILTHDHADAIMGIDDLRDVQRSEFRYDLSTKKTNATCAKPIPMWCCKRTIGRCYDIYPYLFAAPPMKYIDDVPTLILHCLSAANKYNFYDDGSVNTAPRKYTGSEKEDGKNYNDDENAVKKLEEKNKKIIEEQKLLQKCSGWSILDYKRSCTYHNLNYNKHLHDPSFLNMLMKNFRRKHSKEEDKKSNNEHTNENSSNILSDYSDSNSEDNTNFTNTSDRSMSINNNNKNNNNDNTKQWRRGKGRRHNTAYSGINTLTVTRNDSNKHTINNNNNTNVASKRPSLHKHSFFLKNLHLAKHMHNHNGHSIDNNDNNNNSNTNNNNNNNNSIAEIVHDEHLSEKITQEPVVLLNEQRTNFLATKGGEKSKSAILPISIPDRDEEMVIDPPGTPRPHPVIPTVRSSPDLVALKADEVSSSTSSSLSSTPSSSFSRVNSTSEVDKEKGEKEKKKKKKKKSKAAAPVNPNIPKMFTANLEWKVFNPYEKFYINGLSIRPLPVLHGNDYVAYAFEIGHMNDRIVYMSDVSDILPSTLTYLQGGPQIKLLILDALFLDKTHPTHFNMDDAIRTARLLRPSMTVLTGMCHHFNYYIHNDFLKSLADEENIHIEMGFDGLVVPVEL